MTRRRAGPLLAKRIGHALGCVVKLETSGKCRFIRKVMVEFGERVVLDGIQRSAEIEFGRISVYRSIRQWEKGQVRFDRRVNCNCSCRCALGITTKDPLACVQ